MLLAIFLAGVIILIIVPEQKPKDQNIMEIQAVERAEQFAKRAPWSK